jgi:hypothetical protein
MLGHAAGFLAAYVLAVGALMYANTAWFGLGDVKFGADGWQLYWPLWSLFYAPVAFAALVAALCSGVAPRSKKAGLLWASFILILASMEVSFALDVELPVLLVEWVVLAAAFFGAGAVWSDRPTRAAPVNALGR